MLNGWDSSCRDCWHDCVTCCGVNCDYGFDGNDDEMCSDSSNVIDWMQIIKKHTGGKLY